LPILNIFDELFIGFIQPFELLFLVPINRKNNDRLAKAIRELGHGL
jgi:hypothetical protein